MPQERVPAFLREGKAVAGRQMPKAVVKAQAGTQTTGTVLIYISQLF